MNAILPQPQSDQPYGELLTDGNLQRRLLLDLLPRGGVGAEIGVYKGGFSQQLLQVANPRRLHLIDPWKVFDDPRYRASWYGTAVARGQAEMDAIHEGVRQQFARRIADGSVVIERSTSAEASGRFPNDYFDWVYIDGDHTYEAVRDDLRLYLPKVRPGGFIAGDDYALGNWWGDGVVRAVHEFVAANPVVVRLVLGSQFVLRRL
ncbi:class I SAM-dependent methyltransferase [Stella sp.]|uniref:class I SAM-dependent methyltransferase n=1 Tax=Stella sp. TaxID=2912054 RepID=UPI0035B243A4